MEPILEEFILEKRLIRGVRSEGNDGSICGTIKRKNERNSTNNGGDGNIWGTFEGRFERLGSARTKSAWSPLARLWQMRRRSFSQFELFSSSFGESHLGILSASNCHLNHFELTDSPHGFFSLVSHHSSRPESNLREEAPRVSAASSEDYGFLPLPRRNEGPDELKKDLGESKGSGPFFSDDEEEYSTHEPNDILRRSSNRSAERPGSSAGNGKRSSKLKRRKAYYRDKKEGRSRSLTHIDNLDPAMLLRNEDMDSKSEPDTSHDQLLFVPPSAETRESRRKKLARSQVSSSEFFSVCLELDGSQGLEEFLPVTRGTSLGEALRPLCEKKNIFLANVNIFVDSSKTPLPAPASTDTYFVAGKNLIIRAKDSPDGKFHSRSFKQPNRKSSQRGKHKFFSNSTEDASYSGANSGALALGAALMVEPSTSHPALQSHFPLHGQSSISHEGSIKVKNPKHGNRWSGLFSNSMKDNSKMDLLVEQLNHYDKNGIPKLNVPSDTDENDLNYYVEEDWKMVVGGWTEMSEREKQQQTAIWELVETEVVYLRTIKVITDLFLACLYNLQTSNILNEIDRDQLFSNIPDIYKANNSIWLDCILPMVQKARDSKKPLQPNDLRCGFLKFGTTCQPYIRYCLDQTKCQGYCREKYQENELFKAYLAWCETRKECNRLRLMDILVRPMQRMTKYSLLFKAILKNSDDLDQRKGIEEMIGSVERFVKSVNGALRSRQDAERLQGIAERIESYDVVETRDDELESLVKLHSKLDLFSPMPGCGNAKRWLLYEGDLKIKDSFTSKMDVHCFIFTDMFLVCKPLGRKGEKMKVIRQPFVVDRLLSRECVKDLCSFGLIYLNEYRTVSAALSLHSNEPKGVKIWLEHIKKAQKFYSESKTRAHEIETVDYSPGVLEEEEASGMNYLSSRSPRGSSRASQLSSLVHSHSGSIEMNEVSAISSRAISFENELRGSSLSSDDGNGTDPTSALLGKARSLSIEAGAYRPPSPRIERRLFLSKSPTPNTLSVQIPIPNLSGQSLPNLSSASDSSPPSYSLHSLAVPKSLMSPTQRGISYPPPSPRSLRRSHALLQSRNPPLQKTKHIGSPETKAFTAYSLDVQVPEIRGVTPPSNDVSPVGAEGGNPFTSSPELPHRSYSEYKGSPEDVQIVHANPDRSADPVGAAGLSKRLARNDRSDTKRYYTAGAIEDIKKENSRDKDASIHKRLSWNYGSPQAHQPIGSMPDPNSIKNRPFFSSESMASIRSSSGVSSTSSLLHCVSDLETTHEQLPHPDVLIAVSEPEPEEEEANAESKVPPSSPKDSRPETPRGGGSGGGSDTQIDSPFHLMKSFILSDASIESSEV